MDTSIFDKLYRYRERPGKGDFENFCTEVFAYALEGDAVFRNAVLEHLGVAGSFITEVKTQHRAGEWGIPDLLVELNNQIVLLFEVKVESSQGDNQLKRYAEFLQSEYSNHEKHLIFLTKYYEATNVSFTDITLQSLRWYQIHHLITSEMSNWTKELQNLLKTYDMANENKFTVTDLATLCNVSELMTKMDEVLDEVQKHVLGTFPGTSNWATRSTQLQRVGAYENDRKFKYTYLSFGFWERDGEGLPEVYLWFMYNGSEKASEVQFKSLAERMRSKFEWDFEEDGEYGMYISKSRFLADFVHEKEHDLHQVAKAVMSWFDELVSLKDEFKELF